MDSSPSRPSENSDSVGLAKGAPSPGPVVLTCLWDDEEAWYDDACGVGMPTEAE